MVKAIKINLQSLIVSLLMVLPAIAANPFTSATKKTKEATTYVTEFAVVLTTLVIVITGVLTLFNKVQKENFFRIAGAALIIGSATGVADWMLK